MNTMPAGKMTAVARVTKIFGREGELSLTLFDTFPADYQTSEPLFVEIDGLAVPLFCDRFARRGQSGATVLFSDIDTPRRAEELIGHELFLQDPTEQSDEETDEDEIYLEDLIGFQALLDERHRGTIEDFIDGENPLFEISVNGKEAWIPAVNELIAEVDLKNRTVTFELPEGLLELYLH